MTIPTFNQQPAKKEFKQAIKQAPLGKTSQTPTSYSPKCLVPIQRTLFTALTHPYYGLDRLHCYELFWLSQHQVPQVALCTIDYSAHSPAIVESKSLKLYLNSFNTSCFDSEDTVKQTITKDLEAILNTNVTVTLSTVNTNFTSIPQIRCIDHSITNLKQLNQLEFTSTTTTQTCLTHCFRSLCPVTGQPDFATIILTTSGQQCTDQSLFEYFISFNQHQHFHEQCIDQMFAFFTAHPQFNAVTVQGLFTRRGGIDICPIRSTTQNFSCFERVLRQ